MLGDIGIIVGVYAFIRLMALVAPITAPNPTGWPGVTKIAAILGMGLIALATLDIFFSSAIASAFTEGFTSESTR